MLCTIHMYIRAKHHQLYAQKHGGTLKDSSGQSRKQFLLPHPQESPSHIHSQVHVRPVHDHSSSSYLLETPTSIAFAMQFPQNPYVQYTTAILQQQILYGQCVASSPATQSAPSFASFAAHPYTFQAVTSLPVPILSAAIPPSSVVPISPVESSAVEFVWSLLPETGQPMLTSRLGQLLMQVRGGKAAGGSWADYARSFGRFCGIQKWMELYPKRFQITYDPSHQGQTCVRRVGVGYDASLSVPSLSVPPKPFVFHADGDGANSTSSSHFSAPTVANSPSSSSSSSSSLTKFSSAPTQGLPPRGWGAASLQPERLLTILVGLLAKHGPVDADSSKSYHMPGCAFTTQSLLLLLQHSPLASLWLVAFPEWAVLHDFLERHPVHFKRAEDKAIQQRRRHSSALWVLQGGGGGMSDSSDNIDLLRTIKMVFRTTCAGCPHAPHTLSLAAIERGFFMERGVSFETCSGMALGDFLLQFHNVFCFTTNGPLLVVSMRFKSMDEPSATTMSAPSPTSTSASFVGSPDNNIPDDKPPAATCSVISRSDFDVAFSTPPLALSFLSSHAPRSGIMSHWMRAVMWYITTIWDRATDDQRADRNSSLWTELLATISLREMLTLHTTVLSNTLPFVDRCRLHRVGVLYLAALPTIAKELVKNALEQIRKEGREPTENEQEEISDEYEEIALDIDCFLSGPVQSLAPTMQEQIAHSTPYALGDRLYLPKTGTEMSPPTYGSAAATSSDSTADNNSSPPCVQLPGTSSTGATCAKPDTFSPSHCVSSSLSITTSDVQRTVRLQLHVPQYKATLSVSADCVSELKGELARKLGVEVDVFAHTHFYLCGVVPGEPHPPALTDKQLWALPKNSNVFAHAPGQS